MMERKVWIILCCIVVSITGCVTHNAPWERLSSLDALEEHHSILEAAPVTDLDDYFDGKAVAYRIRYTSDDCEVIAIVSAPIDYLQKKYPILLYNRGGNREFGKLVPEQVAYYSLQGYIVLASQYRGVDGGTGIEQFGGDDIHDVLKLIDISEDFEFAQAGGVYMAGHSRGGMMTYMACRKDDRIKAAAVFAGVADTVASFNARDGDMKRVLQELTGGTPEEKSAEFGNRSALTWANEIDTPLLIVHGGAADWRVNSQQSKDMANVLEANGKEYRLILYEYADHSLSGTDYIGDMVRWFNEHPLETTP